VSRKAGTLQSARPIICIGLLGVRGGARAEIMWTDGKFRPCEVLSWARVQPFTQWATGERLVWLVKLRVAEDDQQWFDYVPSCLRPIDRS
jgi:hypothetical protein